MAIKDNKTITIATLNKSLAIVSNTTTNGTDVDTTSFLAVSYGLDCRIRTDGTYTLALLHSDDDGATDAYAAIPAANLIGSYPSLTGVTAAEGVIGTVGVFGAKKWIRPTVVSTSVTTGGTVAVTQYVTPTTVAS